MQTELTKKIEEAKSLSEALDDVRKRMLDGQMANERHLVVVTRLKAMK